MRDGPTEKRPRLLVALLALGLAARLFAAFAFAGDAGDGPGYEHLGYNWFHHASYSLAESEPYPPSTARTPGYPAFVGAVYLVAPNNRAAVRVAQALLDCATVYLVYLIALRLRRSGRPLTAAAIAALCPFTIILVSYVLTETLTTFLAAAVLLLALDALETERLRTHALLGAAMGALVLTRPDFAIYPVVLVALIAWLRRRAGRRFVAGGLVAAAAMGALFAPWTARNAYAMHRFEPLADLYVVPHEVLPVGYFQWLRTWLYRGSDYVPTVFPYMSHRWGDLSFPPDAFDDAGERARVEAAVARSRDTPSPTVWAEAEAEFAKLARERSARHPLRVWAVLPAKRMVSLWASSRTNLFPLPSFAEIRAKRLYGPAVVKLGLMAMNVALIVLALLGIARGRRDGPALVILVSLIEYRTILPAFWGLVEDRYVIYSFPAVFVLAGIGVHQVLDRLRRRAAAA